MMTESFGNLLRSPGHWEFEIFLMILFDGIIVGLLFPFARKHWKHHIARDQAEKTTAYDWSGTHIKRPLWTGSSMQKGKTFGVIFSNRPDDDFEKWPDPGVERCMECMGLIQHIDDQVARCYRCGAVNPQIVFIPQEASEGLENPQKTVTKP